MNTSRIAGEMVERGLQRLQLPKEPVCFTGITEADKIINNIRRYPHFFVLGALMDRQIKAQKAWSIPFYLSTQIGGPEYQRFRRLSRIRIERLMTRPKKLHRFVPTMSDILYAAIQQIHLEYRDRASLIWRGCPSSAEVIYRFLQFEGAGIKIASMSVNILARAFKVPFSDYASIDISPDVHVRRVFTRLGLVRPGAANSEIIYKARSLHPEFPGILDFAAYSIGREWCKSRHPTCSSCYMNGLCPTAKE